MILIESQCLPPLSFFCEVLNSPGILVEQCENYQKRSFRNRLYILAAQGVKLLTIPLTKGKNEQLPIKEVQISYSTNWPLYFDKVITSCYGNAPFFQYYKDDLLAHFYRRPKLLFGLNNDLMNWILSCLDIDIDIRHTTEYRSGYPPEINDLRNKISPHISIHTSKYLVKYEQVFLETNTFIPNLSIIDLLFCMGPESVILLKNAVR